MPKKNNNYVKKVDMIKEQIDKKLNTNKAVAEHPNATIIEKDQYGNIVNYKTPEGSYNPEQWATRVKRLSKEAGAINTNSSDPTLSANLEAEKQRALMAQNNMVNQNNEMLQNAIVNQNLQNPDVKNALENTDKQLLSLPYNNESQTTEAMQNYLKGLTKFDVTKNVGPGMVIPFTTPEQLGTIGVAGALGTGGVGAIPGAGKLLGISAILGKLTIAKRSDANNMVNRADLAEAHYNDIINQLNTDPNYSPAEAMKDWNDTNMAIAETERELKRMTHNEVDKFLSGTPARDKLDDIQDLRDNRYSFLKAQFDSALLNPSGTQLVGAPK